MFEFQLEHHGIHQRRLTNLFRTSVLLAIAVYQSSAMAQGATTVFRPRHVESMVGQLNTLGLGIHHVDASSDTVGITVEDGRLTYKRENKAVEKLRMVVRLIRELAEAGVHIDAVHFGTTGLSDEISIGSVAIATTRPARIQPVKRILKVPGDVYTSHLRRLEIVYDVLTSLRKLHIPVRDVEVSFPSTGGLTMDFRRGLLALSIAGDRSAAVRTYSGLIERVERARNQGMSVNYMSVDTSGDYTYGVH